MNYNTFINKDFRKRPQTKRHPRLRWALFAAGSVVLGVVLANTSTKNEVDYALPDTSAALKGIIENSSSSKSLQLNIPRLNSGSNSSHSVDLTQEPEWTTLTVKNGDSLSALFDKAKIKPDQLMEVLALGDDTRALTRLHPGNKINVIANEEGQLQALNFEMDSVRYLEINRIPTGLTAEIHKHDIEKRSAYASGEIESSLFLASQKAGMSNNLTMELANVFGWDIDFALDIRKGDRFTIIYEEIFKDGEKLKDGDIVAAEFINKDRIFRALRYTNPTTGSTGYYSPDGLSIRKAFLRSPVKFSRISSGFTTRRYHPILHKFRSHKGVDYAAGRGTPIRASGDGKVVYKGHKGGYGKTIILKHGSRYTTLYAHMSNYNRKVRSGSRVKQGQVIGYIGSTGLASGPHLHYEFRVNGVHRNPLKVKFPSTKPIPQRHRDNFELTTQGYVAQLDVLSRNALALLNNN